MPWTQQMLYLTFHFYVASTNEVAQTGVHFCGSGTFDAAAALADWTDGNADDALEAYITLVSDSGVYWADYSHLSGCKMAALATDGTYLGPAKERAAQTDWHGSAAHIVPQCSVVLSTRTVSNLGKGKWGRLFMPHTELPLLTDHPTAGSGATDDAADAGAAFIGTLNGLTNGLTPSSVAVIPSEVSGVGPFGITRVRVGNVNDTQRRRRAQIPEVYSETAV